MLPFQLFMVYWLLLRSRLFDYWIVWSLLVCMFLAKTSIRMMVCVFVSCRFFAAKNKHNVTKLKKNNVLNCLFFSSTETRDILLNFLRDARQRYPDVFNQVIATNAQQAQYAALL